MTALVFGGCSDSGGSGTAARTTAAGPPCPSDPIDVVVSVGQWGDIVEDLAGACARVTTVLASSSADPHDYEPTPADVAKFEGADLVVVNGLFYDDWARRAVASLDSKPAIVDASTVPAPGGASAAAASDDEGADPHIWYAPERVRDVADAVTAQLKARSPQAATYFDARAAEWSSSMQPYFDEVRSIRERAAGTPFAATEPVFSYMGAATGLRDVTPAGYRAAVANATDPSPADIAAFDKTLRDRRATILLVNPQTDSAVTDQLRATAESVGVPVVTVTETVPSDTTSFAQWQLRQLRAVSAAIERARAGGSS